ncbi:MAG: cytidine deaminase [Thermoanaerobaculia bacterium]|nr:cytidine deaminase [Thermoanaerobaculia bacterium]
MPNWDALVAAASAARELAHAPYSDYLVGAAFELSDGTIVAGCNVENRILGLTVCAERNAIANAIVSGRRDFVALAVVTVSTPPAAPCGMCRETLAEFVDDLPILLANTQGERTEVRFGDLLPHRFVLPKG